MTKARDLVGLSRADLAREAGMEPEQLRKIESGGAHKGFEKVRKVLEDKGVVFLDLLTAEVKLK